MTNPKTKLTATNHRKKLDSLIILLYNGLKKWTNFEKKEREKVFSCEIQIYLMRNHKILNFADNRFKVDNISVF